MSDGYIVVIECDGGTLWEIDGIYDSKLDCSSTKISLDCLNNGYRRNIYSISYVTTLDPDVATQPA